MAFEERRKSGVPRLSISQILAQMQVVADQEFDGDLQNNALTVFNQLPTDSKRTLLRKSLLLQWETQINLARNGSQEVVIEQEGIRIKPEELQRERALLIRETPEERASFRSLWHWLVLGVAFIVILAATLTIIYTSRGIEETGVVTSLAARIWRIVDVLFSG